MRTPSIEGSGSWSSPGWSGCGPSWTRRARACGGASSANAAADRSRCWRTSPSRRVQALSVLCARPDFATAQQMRQVVDVAAEHREFGGRRAERGDPGAPIGRRDDRGRAVDQAGEIGAARQAGGAGLSVETFGRWAGDANGQLDLRLRCAGVAGCRRVQRIASARRPAPRPVRFAARRIRSCRSRRHARPTRHAGRAGRR